MSIQGSINSVLSAGTAVAFGKKITENIKGVGSQMQDIAGVSRDQERLQKEKIKQEVGRRFQDLTPEIKQQIISGVQGFQSMETIWQRMKQLRKGVI